ANKQYNSPNPQNATAKCNVTVSEVQAKEPAPVISALSVQPNSFINSNGETVNVYYNLNTEADVSVKITDKSAAEVRTYEKVSLKAGHQSFIWDGKDNSNQLVPTDTYLIRLNAVNVKGEGKNDIKVNVTNAPLQTVDLVECALNSPTLVLADNGTVTMTCDFKMDVDSAKIFVLEGDFDDATKYTSGDVIREIDSLINQKAGNVPFEWDGKELTGKIILVDVEPGTYTMVAEANKSGYETDYVFKKVSVVEELTPPPTDLCANITGVQSTIPSGYVSDGAGNCALSGGTDLCTNMTGVQLTVPAGYVSDGAGNCVVQSGGGGGGGGGTGTETGTGAGTGTGVTKTTTVSSTTNCAGFKDVAASDSACDAIEYVQSIGAMTGNPDGTFAPSDLLQRDQIAKIVLEAFDLYNQKVDYCQGLNPFPDVMEVDWAWQYICRARGLGAVTGYQAGVDKGTYRPERNVNRAEFLAVLLRNVKEKMPSVSKKSYNDVPTGQWYSGYAAYSYDNKLFAGSRLYSTNYVTRKEVAQVLYRLHQLGKL
ncbi:S-layer homology domain-containing protein, partial [Patescibacteria group bacterium]|nr:S-layer homology domain-containing protein [Patescibacteria group bacterium]